MRTLNGIQYLRGLAAIAVVVYHAADRSGYGFSAGVAGVDLFFLLSGFLMILITNERTRPSTFLLDRVFRIAPAYWLATSVFLAGAVAGLFPSVRLTTWHIVSSYAFIPSYSPSNGHIWPLLVPGWTLNLEMAFYCLFAVLLFLRSQVQQVVALVLLLASAVAMGIVLSPRSAIGVTYTDPLLLEFAAGCCIGLAWKRTGAWHAALGWPTLLVSVCALVVVGLQQVQGPRVVIYAIPLALLFISVLALERRKPVRQLWLPLLLGNASYSIYLWQTLTLPVLFRIAEHLGLSRPATVALAVTGTLAAGVVAYKLSEEPIAAFFRRMRKRDRAVAAR